MGAGVAAAVEERERLGAIADGIEIGVNAAGRPDAVFWERMVRSIGPDRVDRLDYVGLDFFPDVFRPIPRHDIPAAVTGLVQGWRDVVRASGVSDDVPLDITETGWPTGPDRDERAQAEVLTLVAQSVAGAGAGVRAYELFGLRDGVTGEDWRTQFGLLRDDYVAKSAFEAVRELIAGDRPLQFGRG